ncbi:hypothetical protein QR98_0064920 [Sarcoptes scabiei]|uniref:Uncharacterized protein n=1 Tax=Sarcoptes scabiei TaxID=52283 RepID=A0A132AAS0_SARSC|nr:hypothetical protein QR98_0064920 [Sarcoptes scabiei]
MDKTLQNEYILEVDEDIANTNNIEENNNTNEMEEFHLRLTERNCQLLKLYHSILYPHLEAYYLIIEKLSLLCEKKRFDTTFDGKVSSPINNPIVNIAKLEQIICETIPLDRFEDKTKINKSKIENSLFSTTMITNVLEFLIKTSSIKIFEDIKLNQNDQKDLDAVDLVDHLVFEPNPIVANHCESFDNSSSSSSSSSTTISLNLIEKDPIDQSSIKCMLSRERLSTMALSIKPFMIR